MPRNSMSSLIARTRKLIADPAGASQVFDEDDVQEALDQQRDDVRYLPLVAAETLAPGGVVTYHDYYAEMVDWEDDVVLLDVRYNVLTPTTSDLIVGHWTFAADTRPPVYLVGKTFDLYRAAADLLEQWAATLKLEYNFSSERRTYNREARLKALADQAAAYRKKGRVRTMQIYRSDADVWG